ncbi:MAG: M14 family metallopeptidase [Gammaproteobacteria bacterium]
MSRAIPESCILCFSSDYAEARAKFRSACEACGVTPQEHICPVAGPDGGTLAIDEARFGDPKASRVLMVLSGTHGVEGFCGSGIQINWLRENGPADLEPRVGVVLLHVINPYGFAWLRRANECNVDLNRNFIDFSKPLPENQGYGEIAEVLCPRDWSDAEQNRTMDALRAYQLRTGDSAYLNAVAGGQYSHAEGLFFGGQAPTWSRRTVEKIVSSVSPQMQHVAALDLHTGLGPYGYGDVRCHVQPDSPAYRRALAWYGEVTNSFTDESTRGAESYRHSGNILDGIASGLSSRCTFTPGGIEYGTRPVDEVLNALRAECWLHFRGGGGALIDQPIKNQMRDAFYPDVDDWKEMVWARGKEVVARAVRGLAAL